MAPPPDLTCRQNHPEAHVMLEIAVFPALSDNFGYLVRDTASGRVAAIDAPEEGAILAELEKRGWTLTDILITHHHSDHTDAIAPLKRRFDAHVIGPREEAGKIAGLDTLVGGGDTVTLGETEIYCGHEYTLSNAKFALSVDPDNAALKTRADQAQRQIDAGQPTIPARISDELAANPFLRADTPELAQAMNLAGAPAWQVFGALRKAKDNF